MTAVDSIHKLLGGLLLLAISTVAQAVEEPEYQRLDSIGEVEIRHYAPVVQAITAMPADSRQGKGFRRLAGFIFGGNDADQSIAMTAPVQENLSGSEREMAFTMPAEYHLDDLPKPMDPNVRLSPIAARTVAVIQFSGWATAGKVSKMRNTLASTLEQENITTTGEWLLNQYNPPWTPPFMRRNEIWVEIDWSQASAAASGAD